MYSMISLEVNYYDICHACSRLFLFFPSNMKGAFVYHCINIEELLVLCDASSETTQEQKVDVNRLGRVQTTQNDSLKSRLQKQFPGMVQKRFLSKDIELLPENSVLHSLSSWHCGKIGRSNKCTCMHVSCHISLCKSGVLILQFPSCPLHNQINNWQSGGSFLKEHWSRW